MLHMYCTITKVEAGVKKRIKCFAPLLCWLGTSLRVGVGGGVLCIGRSFVTPLYTVNHTGNLMSC